jgi:hypothetical protein
MQEPSAISAWSFGYEQDVPCSIACQQREMIMMICSAACLGVRVPARRSTERCHLCSPSPSPSPSPSRTRLGARGMNSRRQEQQARRTTIRALLAKNGALCTGVWRCRSGGADIGECASPVITGGARLYIGFMHTWGSPVLCRCQT